MDLVKLRNDSKRSKPQFRRQDVDLKPQFRKAWRKPKGLHSKMRNSRKGHNLLPKLGYASPKKANGLTRDGLKLQVVRNLNELNNVKDGCVAVGSDVGLRKRIVLLEEIINKRLKLFHVKDVSKYLEEIKSDLLNKKKERKNEQSRREKIKDEIKKQDKKEKTEKKEVSEEELLKKGKVESKAGGIMPVVDKRDITRRSTAPKSA